MNVATSKSDSIVPMLCFSLMLCGCGMGHHTLANEPTLPRAVPQDGPSQPEQAEVERVHDSQLHSLNQFFGESWSRWIVLLNTEASTAARPPVPAWLPDDVRDALKSVFSAAENTVAKIATARSSVASNSAEVDNLAVVVATLNTVLAHHKLGYVVDSVVLGSGSVSSVLLFTFVVQNRVTYRDLNENENEIEIEWVKRHDQLAYHYQLLGFTGAKRRPLILLDTIENWLVTDLLATVGGSKGQVATVPRSFLRSISQSLVAAVGERGIQLAQLIAQRRSLFTTFNIRLLEGHRAALGMPQTLRLDWDWRTGLASVATAAELSQLAKIEDQLASAAMDEIFGRLRDLMARVTEGHELQHQIELRNYLKPSTVPAAAMTAMMRQLGESLNPRQWKWMKGEVSALLAEISRAELGAMLLVARQYRLAIQPVRSLERIAARWVLNLLAGKPKASSATQERTLEQLVMMIEPLSEREIQTVAKRAWSQLFGREFAEFSRTSTRRL